MNARNDVVTSAKHLVTDYNRFARGDCDEASFEDRIDQLAEDIAKYRATDMDGSEKITARAKPSLPLVARPSCKGRGFPRWGEDLPVRCMACNGAGTFQDRRAGAPGLLDALKLASDDLSAVLEEPEDVKLPKQMRFTMMAHIAAINETIRQARRES